MIDFLVLSKLLNLWLRKDGIVYELKSDSMLVVQALFNHYIVRNMRFHISRICREGNHCANILSSFGVRYRCTMWWDLVLDFIKFDFYKNRWNLRGYRFVSWVGFGIVPPFSFVFLLSFMIFEHLVNDWYILECQSRWVACYIVMFLHTIAF